MQQNSNLIEKTTHNSSLAKGGRQCLIEKNIVRFYFLLFLIISACNQSNNTPKENHLNADSLHKNDPLINNNLNVGAKLDSISELQQKDSTLINKYIPGGYSLLEYKSGDLNKDGFRDIIFVYGKHDCDIEYKKWEDSIRIDSLKPDITRRLMILTGDSKGSISHQYRYDSLVSPCVSNVYEQIFYEAGYSGIEIKDNKFILEYYGGMCHRQGFTMEFDYIKKYNNWFLTSYLEYEHSACDGKYETQVVHENKDAKGIISIDSFSYNVYY